MQQEAVLSSSKTHTHTHMMARFDFFVLGTSQLIMFVFVATTDHKHLVAVVFRKSQPNEVGLFIERRWFHLGPIGPPPG